MDIEIKQVGGRVVELKQEQRNGVNIGFIRGYIATWDVDRGDDRFVKGAFLESLNEYRNKSRQIRFKDHHGRTIGGFPIDTVSEDGTGLIGTAEVNLDVQQGAEAYSLAKQGVLTDFSIGFTAIDRNFEDEIRVITKAHVWEGSIVDEPMNEKANVTEVKAATPFKNLPLAPDGTAWSSTDAVTRIRELTGSTEAPSPTYKNAFLWYDSTDAQSFGAYKLPYADVIDGTLTAVPRAIFAAAAAMQGARGGVDIPEADRPRVIAHIEKYYAKLDRESPFNKSLFSVKSMSTKSIRELETLLIDTGVFSKAAAKAFIARVTEEKARAEQEAAFLHEVKELQKALFNKGTKSE